MTASFALLLLLPLLGNAARVDNEFCRPRPTLVPVDNPEYKYFPYFVKLNRCGGSCDHIRPSVKSCVPIEYNEVSVTVQVVGTSETRIIKEKNHTRCGCECVLGPENCDFELEDWKPDMCQCKCRYSDAPPTTPCGAGMSWSKPHCRCMCSKQPEQCGPKKVWSKKACGCVCKERRYRSCAKKQKFVDEQTCMCSSVMPPEVGKVSSPEPHQEGGFRQEFYVMIFLGQFVFMYLVFDAILYRKKAGLIYRVTRSCSRKGDHSNIKESEEDIFNESRSTMVTELPTETGLNNMEATVRENQLTV